MDSLADYYSYRCRMTGKDFMGARSCPYDHFSGKIFNEYERRVIRAHNWRPDWNFCVQNVHHVRSLV